MPLEDICIQEMDRATSRLEVVRYNPTRQFLAVELQEDGRHWAGSPALYQWQNGEWYDTGGNPLDPSMVPEKFRKEIEDTPVTVTNARGPAVTAVCRFCSEKMNSSEMEQHLIKHVQDTMQQAGSLGGADPVPPPVPDEGRKREYATRPVQAKNTHAPDA